MRGVLAIGGDRLADRVDVDDVRVGEPLEKVTAAVDVRLEVARVRADARRELGRDAPAEVFEAIGRRVPRGQHGRPETLEMPVHVARGRTDVVRGDDAPPIAGQPAQDQDQPETRQLVVIEADRWPAQRLEHLVERIGVDGGREPVPDRGGPDGQTGLRTPGVRREVVGQLRDEQDRVVGTDRASRPALVGMAWLRTARPAELRGLRQPCERLGRAGQLHHARAGLHEVEQRLEQRGLPGAALLGGHDDRDATLDQRPQRRTERRVERAGADELHDGSRSGGRRGGTPSGSRLEHRPWVSERGWSQARGPPAYGRSKGASNTPGGASPNHPDLRPEPTVRVSRKALSDPADSLART